MGNKIAKLIAKSLPKFIR